MKKLRAPAGALWLIALAGCDAGTTAGMSGGTTGGTTGTPPGDPATPPPTQIPVDCSTLAFEQTSDTDVLPGGIWLGSLYDCANNVRHDFLRAMVSEDGRFRIMAGNGQLLAGVLQTNGNLFTGNGIDFAANGVEYFSGPTTHLWVDGSIAERSNLVGRWGTEWGSYGYFQFRYVGEEYERPTPLADLAGIWPWTYSYLAGPVSGEWSVELDGQFHGGDDLGCSHAGQFSLIDGRFNIVSVQLAISGCPLDGSYSGLGQRFDLVDWWEKGIDISADDGNRALRMLLLVE